MKTSTSGALAALGGAFLLHSAVALAAPPVPVSPGASAGVTTGSVCPTFSWSPGSAAGELELVVFPFTSEGEPAAEPILSVRLPAGSQSWTPAAERCLPTGGRYAWSLRNVAPGDAGEWSEAAIFEVAVPSRAEVAEALATLRRYLEAPTRDRVSHAPGSPATPGGETAGDALPTPGPWRPAGESPRPGLAEKLHTGTAALHAVELSASNPSYGLYAVSASTLGNGVIGRATADSGQTLGVQGVSFSPNGIGVRGGNLATTGLARGVAGETYSSSGVGVFGRASVTEGFASGVVGESASTDGVGVIGRVTPHSGFSYGVFGFNPSTQGYAVAGVTTATSGLNYGVYGSTVSPAGFAGYFAGNVLVSGALTKGSGSFKIDHPLDPANRYLSHSFVESPDMMNVYNGNVELDGEGAAWVELPEWFEALNRDFRYQLTPLGRPARDLHVAEPVAGNRFRIAGGEPGAQVSWQVTGIRRDAYAERHPILVEEDKGELRGRYLHPEAHGQPAELAIGRPVVPPVTGLAELAVGADGG